MRAVDDSASPPGRAIPHSPQPASAIFSIELDPVFQTDGVRGKFMTNGMPGSRRRRLRAIAMAALLSEAAQAQVTTEPAPVPAAPPAPATAPASPGVAPPPVAQPNTQAADTLPPITVQAAKQARPAAERCNAAIVAATCCACGSGSGNAGASAGQPRSECTR